MELETAQRKLAVHGTMGTVFLAIGVVAAFDAAFRRMSESIQELWMLELGVGMSFLLLGVIFGGSAVRYLVHVDRILEYSDRKARRRSSDDQKLQRRRPKMEELETPENGARGIRLASVKSNAV